MADTIKSIEERIHVLGGQHQSAEAARFAVDQARDHLIGAVRSGLVTGVGSTVLALEKLSDTLSDKADELDNAMAELRG